MRAFLKHILIIWLWLFGTMTVPAFASQAEQGNTFHYQSKTSKQIVHDTFNSEPNNDAHQLVREDLFDVDFRQLDNGLNIISKRRKNAQNVVVLLSVDVGLRDFPCGKQQIAHVLEHALFTGTRQYSEAELKNRINEKAGELNGYTFKQTTYYYIDIHSAYIDRAMKTLYDMMTNTQLTEAKVEHAIKAVHAELGTSDSVVHQSINDELPIFDTLVARLYPNTTMGCEHAVNPSGLTLQDIQQGFDRYYHASNMSLTVVGDFEQIQLEGLIAGTFAKLPTVPRREQYHLPDVSINETANVIEPIIRHQRLLGIEAELGFAIRVVGREHPDAVGVKLLAEHLDSELFRLLRSELGVAYSPKVDYRSETNIGHIYGHMHTTYEWIDKARDALNSFYQQLKRDGLSEQQFQRIKQKRILALESMQFSNLKLAQELVFYRGWIAQHGTMRNTLSEYRQLTRPAVNRLIQEYFPQKLPYGELRPHTKSSGSLLLIKFIIVGLVLAVPIQWILRRLRSR